MSWKHYALAVVVPVAVATTFHWVWLPHPAVSDAVAITAVVVTLAGLVLASPLGKRVAALLALPAYYLVMGFLVAPSIIGGPHVDMPAWAGPVRDTLTVLPFAVLACIALAAVLRSVRRTPAAREPKA